MKRYESNRYEQQIERKNYLKQLMTEFHVTNLAENKQQVLANLANFAYDPSNFAHLRQLNVIDLFLNQLCSTDSILVEFAIGGLCNLALDPENRQQIFNRNGVQHIISCLSSDNEESVLSAITTLMFLITPESKNDVTTLPVIEHMVRFSESSSRRLSNLAQVFLQDFCSTELIDVAKTKLGSTPHPSLQTQ